MKLTALQSLTFTKTALELAENIKQSKGTQYEQECIDQLNTLYVNLEHVGIDVSNVRLQTDVYLMSAI